MWWNRKFNVPGWAREALGEQQSLFNLLLIGGMVLLVAGLALPELVALDWWRALVSALLLLDIAAGAVANFTRGTSGYYAARSRARWTFIAIHFHLPILAFALGELSPEIWMVWAYTIVSASLVNVLIGHELQKLVGGVCVCLGLVLISQLTLSSLALLAALLFFFKVSFSFAVDHYGQGKS